MKKQAGNGQIDKDQKEGALTLTLVKNFKNLHRFQSQLNFEIFKLASFK